MKAVVARDGKAVVADVEVPKPGHGQVLIKVYSTALNRADTMQRQGKYPPPAGTIMVVSFV